MLARVSGIRSVVVTLAVIMESNEDRYVFLVEWYDQPADLVRKYQLTFYCIDNSVDMYDLKNRRIFLKRMQIPSLALTDIFLGNTITVYARQLKVVEYADVFTRTRFENKKARTFGMVKPDAYHHLGKILAEVLRAGFKISRLKMHRFTQGEAQSFYAEHQGKGFFNDLVSFITSDVVVGMELVAENAVTAWRDFIGPTNSNAARFSKPTSLRAKFGTDGSKNAVHGSDSPTSAIRELDLFFGLPSNPAVLSNCTCCVVKPHAMNKLGEVVDGVLEEGFEISALELFNLDRPTAEEFLEVYKGVVPEFSQMVDEMTAGPCVAMEVRQENAVQSFRQIVGPSDPEMARSLRPTTLRAKFGLDRIRNAVHCTDLAEDGVLECQYFFQILSTK